MGAKVHLDQLNTLMKGPCSRINYYTSHISCLSLAISRIRLFWEINPVILVVQAHTLGVINSHSIPLQILLSPVAHLPTRQDRILLSLTALNLVRTQRNQMETHLIEMEAASHIHPQFRPSFPPL